MHSQTVRLEVMGCAGHACSPDPGVTQVQTAAPEEPSGGGTSQGTVWGARQREHTHPFYSTPPHHQHRASQPQLNKNTWSSQFCSAHFFPSGEEKKAHTRQEITQSGYKMKQLFYSSIPIHPCTWSIRVQPGAARRMTKAKNHDSNGNSHLYHNQMQREWSLLLLDAGGAQVPRGSANLSPPGLLLRLHR